MKKKLLSLALSLVMCFGMTVSSAAMGETSITPGTDGEYGVGATFHLSNPVLGTEQIDDDSWADSSTVYLVPVGTVITVSYPERLSSLSAYGMNIFTFTDFDQFSNGQGQYEVSSFTVTEGYSLVSTNTKPEDEIYVRGVTSASAGSVPAGQPAATAAAGWQNDGTGWWWQNDNGSYPSNTWQWIDGNYDGIAECYYFDGNGYCLMNAQTPDGQTVNADGAWVVDGIVQTKPVDF